VSVGDVMVIHGRAYRVAEVDDDGEPHLVPVVERPMGYLEPL
jgi:hypothetical protein